MKLFFSLILMVSALASVAPALTIEEYIALPVRDKIRVLESRPKVADPSKLLQVYTIGLRDKSPKVQRAAAEMASDWFGEELFNAKEPLSEFSHEDTAALQQALVAVLEHDDPIICIAAAAALAYSAPPDPQIEAILLEHIEAEDGTVRGEIVKTMAQAGYSSERFVALTLELMHSKYNYDMAVRVLALLTPDTALDTVIEWVESKESPVRFEALRVLAAYGRRAIRAKPMLERLSEDQTIREGIRLLFHRRVARTLKAITLDNPEGADLGGLLEMGRLTRLRPLALSGDETSEDQELNLKSTALEEPKKPPSQIPSPQERTKEETSSAGDSADSPEEPRDHKWVWLGALVLLIIAVWIVLKRFR